MFLYQEITSPFMQPAKSRASNVAMSCLIMRMWSHCKQNALLKHVLAMQVVAYGISINLVEVTWKSKIKAQFPNPNEYSAFMGDFSSATGAVTFVMMLLSRTIFKRYGWGVAALITPTVLLITGKHAHQM